MLTQQTARGAVHLDYPKLIDVVCNPLRIFSSSESCCAGKAGDTATHSPAGSRRWLIGGTCMSEAEALPSGCHAANAASLGGTSGLLH